MYVKTAIKRKIKRKENPIIIKLVFDDLICRCSLLSWRPAEEGGGSLRKRENGKKRKRKRKKKRETVEVRLIKRGCDNRKSLDGPSSILLSFRVANSEKSSGGGGRRDKRRVDHASTCAKKFHCKQKREETQLFFSHKITISQLTSLFVKRETLKKIVSKILKSTPLKKSPLCHKSILKQN